MLLATLLLSIGSTVGAVQGDRPPIDPARVETAVKELEAAFKSGTASEARVAAIRKNFEVSDARVAQVIEKGLADKDQAVQAAAVDALGRMPLPAALEGLHRFYRAEVKRLRDDHQLMPLVIQSIGRHGSETSIELLSDDLFLQRTFPAIKARIWSLGNIRSRKSVEALFGMMNKAGVHKVNEYGELFRVALARLTGADNGPDCQMWLAWWRDKKQGFKLPAEVPDLADELERPWNEYWGIRAQGAGR